MILKQTSYLIIVLSFLFNGAFVYTIENSIVAAVEKFESLENLPARKFSSNQYNEIAEALNHQEERIRVMSYNLLFDLFDHKLAPVNRWPNRLPRVVALLEEMQPDIIGVQELYKNQLDDLLPSLGEDFAFYAKPCEDGELNGIFYRKSRFEVIDSQVWYMTATPDVPSSETLTMIQLKDLRTGKLFAVFNAHLAFGKIDKREFQARFVAEKTASVAKEMSVLFMGDLNIFPGRLDLTKLPAYDGDYIHRILTKGPLKYAPEVSLLGHLGPISTHTNGSEDGVPFTGTGTPGVILDRIYVTEGIQVLIHAVQPATVQGHFPSDHMPVMVDMILLENHGNADHD